MIIGLTGLYCAGKNFIASLFELRGIPVLDVDKLGHSVIDEKKTEITVRFGEHILNPDGSVNRRLLGKTVFGNENELSALENIIHPEVNRQTDQWIDAQSGKDCVVNAALIHKSAAFGRLDRIVIVNAPCFIRMIRAKRRDKLPWTVIFRRLSNQKQFKAQYLAGKADIYKVENSCCCTDAYLKRQIDVILSN